MFRFLRELLDVDTTGAADGDALVYDGGTEKWVPGAGGGGASAAGDVSFTPAGGVAATDVQAAIEELDAEKAAASHAHSGSDITSGTVADARIASTIARDSEVTSAISALSTVYQPLDSDLSALAALTTTAFGRGLLELANQAALLSAAGAAAASHSHAASDISSGQVALARGGTAASLTDPNADRIMFWDDSAGAVTWLAAGSGLTITDTTITASGSSATGEEETLVIAMQLFA